MCNLKLNFMRTITKEKWIKFLIKISIKELIEQVFDLF